MIACVDVDYCGDRAQAACVLLRDWADATSAAEYVTPIHAVEEYTPGEFYRRELPCLLAVLARVREPVRAVVIDGYVWLRDGEPGLGAHLFRALGEAVPVMGVAKTCFRSATRAEAVTRGVSRRPLFVSAAGLEPGEAAAHLRAMHGEHRLPTALTRADRLGRATASGPAAGPTAKSP